MKATRWESATSDPQWIYVDLGSSQSVARAIIRWETAYASSFKIQTSPDGSTWTDKYSTTTGTGGVSNIPFASTYAKYVRMSGTVRGTTYAYSIYDFEVYGN